uniref:Target of myb1 like 2 membrane trafficking protein n=1 Tax=Eptatretus burgeri TaxID=7764 RepID=A0A8C4Q1C7_EPTBU
MRSATHQILRGTVVLVEVDRRGSPVMSLMDLVSNPFGSPVGQRIERATNGALKSEDWALNMEICDLIAETEDGPKDAIRALRKRLSGNKNFHEVMLALTVLETGVKNCGHRFHALVSSRDFLEGVLLRLIQPKNNPPMVVQDRVLLLIQAWADAFRSSPELTGAVHVYEDLKRKGVEFPAMVSEPLSPIHTPRRSVRAPLNNTVRVPAPMTAPQWSFLSQQNTATDTWVPTPLPNTNVGGFVPTTEQVTKLEQEIEVVRGNIRVLSEMLHELAPGQETPSDLELLQDLHGTCHAMQRRVVDLLAQLSDERLTSDLLNINDDLNNVFLRYDRFERLRTGRTGYSENHCTDEEPIHSPVAGMVSPSTMNRGDDAMIDLGPGSPSVVAGTHHQATLSSQLATLEVGESTTSGTLRSLQTYGSTPAPHLTHDAQTNRRSDASVLAIPVSQPTMMDNVEQWLNTDSSEEHKDHDGVTSEEFDRFLEERARVADNLPNLPLPPTNQPSSPNRHRQRTPVNRSDGDENLLPS